jgi:hypothetical protein
MIFDAAAMAHGQEAYTTADDCWFAKRPLRAGSDGVARLFHCLFNGAINKARGALEDGSVLFIP